MVDLQNILTLPEGKTLEFKRDLSSLKPILKTLVAFVNTAGGTLLIGRDDEGNLHGVEDIFHSEEKIANAISDNIYPPLMAEIETTSMEGKSLLVIRVAHWGGPFYLKSQGPEAGVYIRLGSTNRVAGPEILEELQRSIAKISYDQLPCPDIDEKGLDMKKIEQAFSSADRKVDQNKLKTLGILVPYSGKYVCSNGGLILFGADELRERYFPNSFVRCARFRGTDKVEFIDQYDVDGTIIEAMKEVPKFIRRNTRLAAKIERIRRKDIPEYSPIAVREILTNALVHADYSIKGMCPRIAIFSDRLEIESLGMLPFGYTFNDFFAGVSHIRNKVIARVFRELNLMEEWGTGYKRIIGVCESEGYATPEWKELGTAIRVLLRPHPATRYESETILSSEKKELTQRQRTILTILSENKMMTAKEIHSQLAEPISLRMLRTDLGELKSMGLIQTMGRGPSTSWALIQEK